MKILFESLLSLIVLVPFFTSLMLWACLFMAGMADRDEAQRFADGENGQPVEDGGLNLHRGQA